MDRIIDSIADLVQELGSLGYDKEFYRKQLCEELEKFHAEILNETMKMIEAKLQEMQNNHHA